MSSQPDRNKMSDPLATTGRITLPFPVLRVEWFNGKGGADPQKYEVSHFGGWYIQLKTTAYSVEEVLSETGRSMLTNFPLVSMNGKDGPFQAYASRTITVCPILKRIGWFTNDKGNPYSSVQILVWASIPNAKTKTFDPWGPVLLKAKSLTGVSITNALYNWGQKIKSYATEAQPAWAHWVTLGTLRPQIYTESRGKGKDTSLATPCEFYFPTDKDPAAFVTGRYVGDKLRDEFLQARDVSQDWADAWNLKYNQRRTGQAAEEAEDDSIQPPDNYAPEDQNVPF